MGRAMMEVRRQNGDVMCTNGKSKLKNRKYSPNQGEGPPRSRARTHHLGGPPPVPQPSCLPSQLPVTNYHPECPPTSANVRQRRARTQLWRTFPGTLSPLTRLKCRCVLFLFREVTHE